MRIKIKELKEDYPLVYNAALRNQVEQGNKVNDELYLSSPKKKGNFNWHETKENYFWVCIDNKDFDQARKLQPDLFLDKNKLPDKQFTYKEIMELDFDTQKVDDSVYFDQYGFDYEIISLKLTGKIQLIYSKETRTVEMQRFNNKHEQHIVARWEIQSRTELDKIIEFYKNG